MYQRKRLGPLKTVTIRIRRYTAIREALMYSMNDKKSVPEVASAIWSESAIGGGSAIGGSTVYIII